VWLDFGLKVTGHLKKKQYILKLDIDNQQVHAIEWLGRHAWDFCAFDLAGSILAVC